MSSEAWRSDPTGSYKVYDGPFLKPSQDNREYRLIQLANGLEAIVVHDDTADKAAACLTVAVGYLQDPVCTILLPLFMYSDYFQPDMPGLAHFCEHMLSKVTT